MKLISTHLVSSCLVCGNQNVAMLQSEVSPALRFLQCTNCGWNVGIWLGGIDELKKEWDQTKRDYQHYFEFINSKFVKERLSWNHLPEEQKKTQETVNSMMKKMKKIINNTHVEEITPEVARQFQSMLR